MLSDLAKYYEDIHPVSPFLIAPVLEQQDTLIIGPRTIASEHDRFLNESFRRMPLSLCGFLYLRVFTYQSRIAIILVFPTSVMEESSKRTGLVLTLGALVENRVFKEYFMPSSRYFSRFINITNGRFDVDLLRNGADEIIRQINDENYHDELRSKFSLTLDDLLRDGARFRPRKSWLSFHPQNAWFRRMLELRMRMLTKRKQRGLPKVILCNHLDRESIIQLFLGEIDRYLGRSHFKNIDVANQISSGGKSIEFIAIERPQLDNITDLAPVKFNHRRFLRLY